MSEKTIDSKPQKIFVVSDTAEKTIDGFQNFAAKLGVGPDHRGKPANLLSDGHYEFNLITRNRVQLEAAYRGSWIVGQVIDTVAEDMTRAGIEVTTNEEADLVPDLMVKMSRLQIWQQIANTVRWARLYGGAIAVMQIEGEDLAKPLDMGTVGQNEFKGLVVYDRWQVYPVLSELINSGPDMGLPAYYDIVLGSNLNDPGQEPGGQRTDNPNAHIRVHYSRCLRMEGIRLPFFQAITEMMWGESVLERMWDRLIAFDTASLSTGNLINRAQLRTVGVNGLREILAAGGKAQEALVQQFEYMRMFQQNEGITLLDKEDEFASTAYSFAGLSDVLSQFGQQVSGSAQIPLIRLFGQSPTGLNSNGDNDIRQYYDGINQKQEYTLRDPLEVIIKLTWQSMTGKPAPKDLAFEFTPLWQMSAIDKANVAKTNTDTVLEAHEHGLISSACAMKELKQSSGDHGLFTHITDEDIEAADDEIPPTAPGGSTTGDPGEGPATPESQIEAHAQDEQKRKSNGQFGEGAGEVHHETHRGHEIHSVEKEGGHELYINGYRQEGKFTGHATAVQRGKTLVNRKLKRTGDSIWKKLKGLFMFKKKVKDEKWSYVTDPGIPGTMKEFYKGTLKSSSGKKVTSKKQALAIGYSEERRGKDARSVIKDYANKK